MNKLDLTQRVVDEARKALRKTGSVSVQGLYDAVQAYDQYTPINISPTFTVEQWSSWQDPETWPEFVRWSDELGAYTIPTADGPQIIKDGAYFVIPNKDAEIEYLTTALYRAMWALHQADPKVAVALDMEMIRSRHVMVTEEQAQSAQHPTTRE